MFQPANDHLELLLEFGLGTGDGGPWRQRLGLALDTPADMMRGQLEWAVTHGMAERAAADESRRRRDLAAGRRLEPGRDGRHLGARRAGRLSRLPWRGRPGSVEFLVELGFDVNAKGRTDVPSDQPWQTALPAAAESGDVELARTLLRLGADPDVRDQRFGATALGWARYLGQPLLVEVLEPITAPG